MVAQLSEGALVGEAGPTENLGTWMQLLGFLGAFFQYFRGGRGKTEDNWKEMKQSGLKTHQF